MSNTQAVDRYTWYMENIRAMLSNLTEYVDDFDGVAPDSIDWSHVNAVAGLHRQLRNVCIFVGVMDEAAEATA